MDVYGHRSRKHAINDVRRNTTAIFETQFNDILVSGPQPGKAHCANKSFTEGTSHVSSKTPDAANYEDEKSRFALFIFHACRANMIRNCNNPRCVHYKDKLKLVMPPCATWPGLRRWALQVAACTCYANDDVFGPINFADVRDWIPDGARISFEPGPAVMSYVRKPPDFTDWASKLNIRDVLDVFSWLEGILSEYKHISLRGSFRSIADIDNDRAYDQALSRISEQSLCHHRIGVISKHLPGRESNIAALIPKQHQPCSYRHKFCSTGRSHKDCTWERCEISTVNFTKVKQLHRPGCKEKCGEKKFSTRLLDEAVKDGRSTAWAFDGKRLLEFGEDYMAISHVWSDGTGGHGSVNKCLYDFFCDVARNLGCEGLWWDAICLPQGEGARDKALKRMHVYYSEAAYTVVHDLCLATSEWIDVNHASFALVMSNWFTRGWTALELARSERVKVLFTKSPGYVLKDLDHDILSNRRTVSSLSRLLVCATISGLRKDRDLFEKFTLNEVLTSLGPRFTSWASDRAIITGLFVGVEKPTGNQRSIYEQVIRKIGWISSDQLFHKSAPTTGPFAWFPSDLYDIPISSEMPNIKVRNDGSIIGTWHIDPDLPSSVDNQLIWDRTHEIAQPRVRQALRDQRHIILLERQNDPNTRGLLVKVMKYNLKDRSNERRLLLCRYIGLIYFRTPRLASYDSYRVIIGDGGVDLAMGVSALSYIKRFHQQWTFEDEMNQDMEDLAVL